MSQLSLYDAKASEAARDRSIQQVDEHAEPEWKALAYEAVRQTASDLPFGFTTDDVWLRIPEDAEPPHEPRAMGAIMRQAHRDGWIVPTRDHRPTARIVAHRNPKRVWRAA